LNNRKDHLMSKKATQVAPAAQADERPLEDRLRRLEEIARILDVGDRPLDEQLKLYSEGMTLAATCRAELEQAQLRVEELAK
jgi:exodeoxyribonuclease VII small subunit